MCWYDSKNADTIAEYRANQSKEDWQREQLTLKSEIFWKQQVTIGKAEVFPNYISMLAEIPPKMNTSVLNQKIFWKQQVTIGRIEVFSNHTSMLAEIPLKMGVSVFVGDLKGKSIMAYSFRQMEIYRNRCYSPKTMAKNKKWKNC